MSDQHLTGATTYTTSNRHKRRTCMPSAGFKQAIPAVKQLQTYALDHMTTEIRIDGIKSLI